VEAAVARGERTTAVLRREVLPNIMSPVIADLGLRYTFSILLVAAVNFLGLGLQPPASDWALMISENREIISLNPWSIFVPAALIAVLTIGVNAVGDAIARSLGHSDVVAEALGDPGVTVT
jgi:ABC-type dipeptide/oligopeptide/nickel transport system permease subunit